MNRGRLRVCEGVHSDIRRVALSRTPDVRLRGSQGIRNREFVGMLSRRLMHIGALAAAGVAAVSLGACCEPGLCSDPTLDVDAGPIESSDGGSSATLSNIQATIFTPSCATMPCHSQSSAQYSGTLDLSSASTSYAQLVGDGGVPAAFSGVTELRVDPGHPESSFLIVKLSPAIWSSSYSMLSPPPDGNPMPFGSSAPITDAQLQLIQDWISAGAQND